MMRAIAAAAAITLTAAACAPGVDSSKVDLDEPTIVGEVTPDTFEQRSPQKVVVWNNVDLHPTVVQLCIDGVAFRSLSSTHSGLASPALERVPEWDEGCPS